MIVSHICPLLFEWLRREHTYIEKSDCSYLQVHGLQKASMTFQSPSGCTAMLQTLQKHNLR